MSEDQQGELDRIVEKFMYKTVYSHYQIGLNRLRYEVVRKLNVRQFLDIRRRVRRGERFDDLVDALVLEANK